VKKNAEHFARSDLDLSDCEKERIPYGSHASVQSHTKSRLPFETVNK